MYKVIDICWVVYIFLRDKGYEKTKFLTLFLKVVGGFEKPMTLNPI